MTTSNTATVSEENTNELPHYTDSLTPTNNNKPETVTLDVVTDMPTKNAPRKRNNWAKVNNAREVNNRKGADNVLNALGSFNNPEVDSNFLEEHRTEIRQRLNTLTSIKCVRRYFDAKDDINAEYIAFREMVTGCRERARANKAGRVAPRKPKNHHKQR